MGKSFKIAHLTAEQENGISGPLRIVIRYFEKSICELKNRLTQNQNYLIVPIPAKKSQVNASSQRNS